MSDSQLAAALDAIRWLLTRNADLGGAAHIVALVQAIAATASAEQLPRLQQLVDALVEKWRYWAPDYYRLLDELRSNREPRRVLA